jgi:malate synthase
MTIEVTGPLVPGSERVLTPAALEFIADLQTRFGQSRLDLLGRRVERQAEIDAGGTLQFSPATRHVREAE